jgi:hypothetical protein
VGEDFWSLEGGEVSAFVEAVPVHDVVIVAFGEGPDGLEVVFEYCDSGGAWLILCSVCACAFS